MLHITELYIFVNLILFILCNEDVRFVPELSLSRPYHAPGVNIEDWRFTGNTFMRDGYVSLTSDFQNQVGGMWTASAVHFPAWQVNIQFQVCADETKAKKEWYGDGFAVWYVKEPGEEGRAFGYKENFIGLGVFLDTYNNHNGPHNHLHPYVSAMVNDGTRKYDHDTDGTLTQLAEGCEFFFRSQEETAFITIRYENMTLSVYRNMNTESPKLCFESKDVDLPTGYYFGVTAATGDLSARVEDKPRFFYRFMKAFLLSCLAIVFIGLLGKFIYSSYMSYSLRSKRFY